MNNTQNPIDFFQSHSVDAYSIKDEVALLDVRSGTQFLSMMREMSTDGGNSNLFTNKLGRSIVTLLNSGTIECEIDSNSYKFESPGMLVALKDKMVRLVGFSDDLKCRIIMFSDSFLKSINLPEKLNTYFSLSREPYIKLENSGMDAINNYFDMSFQMMRYSDNPYRLDCLRSLTAAFFYGAGYYYHMKRRQRDKNTPEFITEQFMELVKQYGRKFHYLDFYADKLCITKKYMSTCVRQSCGHTALEILQEHVVQSAMEMLKYSDKTFAEISEELGFDSTESFGKYFKRVAGFSPRSVRTS